MSWHNELLQFFALYLKRYSISKAHFGGIVKTMEDTSIRVKFCKNRICLKGVSLAPVVAVVFSMNNFHCIAKTGTSPKLFWPLFCSLSKSGAVILLVLWDHVWDVQVYGAHSNHKQHHNPTWTRKHATLGKQTPPPPPPPNHWAALLEN